MNNKRNEKRVMQMDIMDKLVGVARRGGYNFGGMEWSGMGDTSESTEQGGSV